MFCENFVAIQLERVKVLYNKPIYIGFTTLDLSKLLMYDYFYDYIKPKYNDRATLCYMDTDSFTFSIQTDDLYADMRRDLDRYDTSNYSPSNPYDMPLQGKAVLGRMKDENAGNIMLEFVGLRPKMYAYNIGEWVKKVKGVKKCVVRDEISGSDFKECLANNTKLYKKQNLFRSIKHTIFSITQSKLALSSNDDKRWICPDGIRTLAWGHADVDSVM